MSIARHKIASVNGPLGFFMSLLSFSRWFSCSKLKISITDPLIAPVIIQVTGNLTVLEGQRVTLSCKATGNPLPHISWRISLDRNSADRQPERPSPGSIRILSASPRDSGTYSCIASNKRGNDTRVVYLKVLGKVSSQ